MRTALTSFIILSILLSPTLTLAKEDPVVEVVEATSRAIVNIRTEEWAKKAGDTHKADFLRRFLSGEETEESEALENIGSGVVLDPRGIIVTNEHLVAKAVTIKVKFTNRQEYDAYVLATDPELDIALLRVNDMAADFPYLKIKDKRPIRVGEKAIVIGNPYGLSSSVTTGVISALGRNLKISNKIYANLIQTDAAINPGSSGGALLAGDGTLLGIVTAIYEEGKGIGFAIPIDDVTSMLSEFLESGSKRPILGAFIDKRKDERGFYVHVTKTIQGSPAERYGIRVGDRIVEMNKKRIREGMKVTTIFRSGRSGGPDQFRIVRNGEVFTVSVNVKDVEEYVPSPVDELLLGLRISDLSGYAKLKYKLREKNGVVVSKVLRGGIGERYGLRSGDVILKINNADVADKERFQSLMVEGLRRNYILYQVKRGDNVFFLPVKLDALL